MNYDKNSFLAGISVGRTLKGWASGNVSSGGDSRIAEIIPVTSYVPQFSVPVTLDTLDAVPVTSYLEE